MKLFKKSAPDEIFTANCQSREGDMVVCKPELTLAGKKFTSERPVQIKLEQGERAFLIDDGGAPDFLIERLLKDIEKKRLR